MTTRGTVYVLHHTAGALVPEGRSVREHPMFGEHVAFLRRRQDAGQLVLAGPLDGGSAAGLTVLDVASLEEATRLATEDDGSVVAGLLHVDVWPWTVVMARDDA